MNSYQTQVVSFFHDYAEPFTKQLLITLPQEYTFVDDIFPRVIKFIDEQIHKEMKMHSKKSEGYNHFLDMLIEIHTPMSDDFKAAIINEINSLFRN